MNQSSRRLEFVVHSLGVPFIFASSSLSTLLISPANCTPSSSSKSSL